MMMPRVMDNLMPHMIGDVVPLVAQPMIDYLRGKHRNLCGKHRDLSGKTGAKIRMAS